MRYVHHRRLAVPHSEHSGRKQRPAHENFLTLDRVSPIFRSTDPLLSMTPAARTFESRDVVPPELLEPPEPGRCARAGAAPPPAGYLLHLARQEPCGRRVL